jgi:hypothetical protein
MRYNLETILELQFEGQDVDLFIDMLGNMNQAILDSRSKPGFKNKNKFTLQLQDETIEFIEKLADKMGLFQVDETSKEQGK